MKEGEAALKPQDQNHRLSIIILICLLLTSCYKTSAESTPLLKHLDHNEALEIASVGELTPEVRGAWIASIYNINFPSAPDLPEETLKKEVAEIIDTSKKLGLNTLFFQAHPCSDALYESQLFPVSKYLSSEKTLYFDPLRFIIDMCHEKGISLYAWINPLRVTVDSFTDKKQAIASLDPSKWPGMNPELLVYYNDGKLYLDPGFPEVRNAVAECVREIIANYEVDGIVFDDYFYPYPTGTDPFDDSLSFSRYKTGTSLEDWRRANVNSMIEQCYTVIKEHDDSIRFGVAPFGIWKNGDGGESGSLTGGLESYYTIYCDPLTWAEQGCVDFLSPQLYWSSDNTVASFSNLYEWWSTALDGTGVDYIPSLGAYNYGGDWVDPQGIITEQVTLARKTVSYSGVMYYGLEQLMKDTNGISSEITELNKNSYYYYDSARLPNELMIDTPITGMVFDNTTITISGISDIHSPLFINDEKTARNQDGSFSVDYTLTKGENDIVVSCGSSKINLKLYYN